MRRTLTVATNGKPAGATGPTQRLAALFASAALLLSGCGGGETADSGRSSPAYTVGGTIAGLDEGHVDISNGLDVKRIAANPNGLALDEKFTLDTSLPAGAGYDVRIINDPQAEFALQCDVVNGSGTMPAGPVSNVLVRCARIKSLRLLAGTPNSRHNQEQDGLAIQAGFADPRAVTFDTAGNLYVADSDAHTIRRMTPSGIVTTIAGRSGAPGSEDATGTEARFSSPEGIAADPSGVLYVTDSLNGTIRRIKPGGIVDTLAGDANQQPRATVDGTGKAARFERPVGIVRGPDGNFYVTDSFPSCTIRRVTPLGEVRTIAGSKGDCAFVNATGTAAKFFNPRGIGADEAGNLYVADRTNGVIRWITPAGDVETFAGNQFVPKGVDGPGTQAGLDPEGIVVGAGGHLYVTEPAIRTIRHITPAREVTTLAGKLGDSGATDGAAADARFKAPIGVTLDAAGNLFVTDLDSIRRITTDGIVSTIAGRAEIGFADGSGSAARFGGAAGVTVDKAGNVFVADTANKAIRRITPGGVVSTIASPASAAFSSPRGIATDSAGNIYVTDNNAVRRIDPLGAVSTVAGSPGLFSYAPGTGTQARFAGVLGIAVDAADNLYVADSANNMIRRITPNGFVEDVAGSPPICNGVLDYSPDFCSFPTPADGKGSAARFRFPSSITIDGSGRLYVTDGNRSIRQVTPDGVVTTLAADTTFASRAAASDANGNLYVIDGDTIKFLIRAPDGKYRVETVAGKAGESVTRLGPLPGSILNANSLALSSKRVYITIDTGVLFFDR